jgi:hypothetical protein
MVASLADVNERGVQRLPCGFRFKTASAADWPLAMLLGILTPW